MQTKVIEIRDHWDELHDGDVVDVRVILNESGQPAEPEIWTEPTI